MDPAIVVKLQKRQTNLQNVSISSVDLGIRNLAATVIRTWKNSEVHESNVLHKSKDYHYKTGKQHMKYIYIFLLYYELNNLHEYDRIHQKKTNTTKTAE